MLVRHLIDYLLQDLAATPATRGVSEPPDAAAAPSSMAEFCRDYPWRPDGGDCEHRPQAGASRRPRPFYYTGTEEAQLFAPLLPIYAYACVDAPQAATEPLRPGTELTPADYLLFDALNGLEPGQSLADPLWEPEGDRLAELVRTSGLRLWACWRGLVSESSAFFLALQHLPACVSSEDGEGFLAHNIRTDYFHLFLYCLQQRMILQRMAECVQIDWTQPARRLTAQTRELVAEFMTFRSQCWFTDVTSRQQGETIYDIYRRGLGLGPLYDTVATAVQDIGEHNEAVRERHLNDLLSVLTVIGLPVATVIGYYQITGPYSWRPDQLLEFAGALAAAFTVTGFLYWLYTSRRQ